VVALDAEGLVEALRAGGLPCTVDELNARFAGFVERALRGRERRTTRLTIEAAADGDTRTGGTVR
jgi:hypothetical protein